MYRFITYILIFIVIIGCSNEPKKNNGNKARIEFESVIYDFGKIEYGSEAMCEFRFSNSSNKPLIINKVKADCGCTSPEWPKEPFEHGMGGAIKVKYNTKTSGIFRKNITVYSNAINSPLKLIIIGEVKPQ